MILCFVTKSKHRRKIPAFSKSYDMADIYLTSYNSLEFGYQSLYSCLRGDIMVILHEMECCLEESTPEVTLLHIILDLLLAPTYRLPRRVSEIRVFSCQDAYAVCPRCKATMEREYQKYCDRCGQKLSWSKYDHAEIRYIGWD